MSEFTRVVDAVDVPPGKSVCVEFGGEKVALFNVGGTIYAVSDTCTHAGGPLSEGQVDGPSSPVRSMGRPSTSPPEA